MARLRRHTRLEGIPADAARGEGVAGFHDKDGRKLHYCQSDGPVFYSPSPYERGRRPISGYGVAVMAYDEPENLTLVLLREMRLEMRDRFDKLESEIGEIKADMREVKLTVSLLEAERLEKIEKHLGLLPS
jgi:hypothetical protein